MATVPSKEASARELINWHFRIEPALTHVIWFRSSNDDALDDPIRLLEVNGATVPTGDVMTFGFAGNDEIPYPTVVAEITPDEYQLVQEGKIPLPDGWSFARSEIFTRQAS